MSTGLGLARGCGLWGEICFARGVDCVGVGWGWGEALVKLRKAAVRQEKPPMGSLDARQGFPFFPKKILQAKFYAGKGKPWNKADNFCLIVRKHDETRGSHEAADNFCRFLQ